jgi:hypothetical protein
MKAQGCREYDEWQFFRREELRNQLANVLERLSRFYESCDDFDTAIQVLHRAQVLHQEMRLLCRSHQDHPH